MRANVQFESADYAVTWHIFIPLRVWKPRQPIITTPARQHGRRANGIHANLGYDGTAVSSSPAGVEGSVFAMVTSLQMVGSAISGILLA